MASSSFTEAVVAELAPHVPLLSHCRAALLQGMALADRGEPGVEAVTGVVLSTPRSATARLALAALHAGGVPARLVRVRTPRRHRWAITAPGPLPEVSPGVRACCDRALVRGAFLAAGSLTRTDGPPHLEIAARSMEAAGALCDALDRLGVHAGAVRRRARPVVLVRTIDGVASTLSGIGAQGGRLRFEEGRVVREVRSGVNRRLNSETANLRRTVDAAVRQATAAEGLQRDPDRWRTLPSAVREAATLRLRHPDETLARLAARAGISRPAMADRLRRLEAAVVPGARFRSRPPAAVPDQG
jgi:LAGLIDADG DNA endonuclease family protein/WhiA-like protein